MCRNSALIKPFALVGMRIAFEQRDIWCACEPLPCEYTYIYIYIYIDIWFSLRLLRLFHLTASTCACRCLCLCVRLLLDSPTVKIKSDAAVLRGTKERWARYAQPKVATICSGHQREGAEHRSARRKVHDDAHDHRSLEVAESVAHDHLPLEVVERGAHDAFLLEVVEVCHDRRRELLRM